MGVSSEDIAQVNERPLQLAFGAVHIQPAARAACPSGMSTARSITFGRLIAFGSYSRAAPFRCMQSTTSLLSLPEP